MYSKKPPGSGGFSCQRLVSVGAGILVVMPFVPLPGTVFSNVPVSLFMPDVIDQIHGRLGQSFFAIPSSVHEFIIIPESSGMTMAALNNMCREANATVVRYNEILSDNVLYMPYKK